jgi:hypothetical protein
MPLADFPTALQEFAAGKTMKVHLHPTTGSPASP